MCRGFLILLMELAFENARILTCSKKMSSSGSCQKSVYLVKAYKLRTVLCTGQKQIYFIRRIVVSKRCENTPCFALFSNTFECSSSGSVVRPIMLAFRTLAVKQANDSGSNPDRSIHSSDYGKPAPHRSIERVTKFQKMTEP